MKKKTEWIVPIVMLVAVAAIVLTVILVNNQKNKQDASQTDAQLGSQAVFSVNPSEIEVLQWNYGEEELSFTFDGDSWYYTEDKDFPLNESLLEEMVGQLKSIISYNTIQNPQDPASYGLDKPICTISVTANGTTSKVMIGDQSVAGSIFYLSTGDDKVHMVDGALFDAFYRGLYDLVACEELPNIKDVWGLKISGHGELDLSCVWDEQGICWYANAAGEKIPLDFNKTEEFVANLQKITLDKCVSYNAGDDLQTQYGLGEKAARITVNYAQDDPEKTVTIELGYALEEGTYIRLEGSKMVYMIDSRAANILRATQYTSLLPAQE